MLGPPGTTSEIGIIWAGPPTISTLSPTMSYPQGTHLSIFLAFLVFSHSGKVDQSPLGSQGSCPTKKSGRMVLQRREDEVKISFRATGMCQDQELARGAVVGGSGHLGLKHTPCTPPALVHPQYLIVPLAWRV